MKIFDKKIVDISSERPGNYTKCMLWPRCQFSLDLSIQILVRESDLRSVFIEIGTPSALGVRRDEREREC